MKWLSESMTRIKTGFVLTALVVAAGSLFYSHTLTRDLYAEEVAKMDVWAEAMRSLTVADEGTDLNLVLKVINSNNTIPVVVTDAQHHILAHRNLDPEPRGKDSLNTLAEAAKDMRKNGQTMCLDLSATGNMTTSQPDYLYISYEESVLLRRLTIYPYVQLGVVGILFIVAIVALIASKRAEQNRVWVGLSRETAHQLGTPISSLMAWNEVLCETYPDDELLPEMNKDIHRLQLIAERFSKIGSAPELKEQNLSELIQRVAEYYDRRTSRHLQINLHLPSEPVPAVVNAPLFEWVIENLCKNAVDAMEGKGTITITVQKLEPARRHCHVQILVADTGKGISRNRFKTVFKPGFTTKQRGWGLGLSLAKRIVEEYHHGYIYVMDSHPGKGTVFAIDI